MTVGDSNCFQAANLDSVSRGSMRQFEGEGNTFRYIEFKIPVRLLGSSSSQLLFETSVLALDRI